VPASADAPAAPAVTTTEPAAVTPPITPPPAPEPVLPPAPPGPAPPGHPTHFEPWYRGPNAPRRFFHMGLTLAFEIAAPLVLTISTPSDCRWCNPGSLDASVRNRLVWHDVNLADTLSTINTYYVGPIAGAVLLYLSDKDESWRRLIDDTLPVAESIAVTQFLTNVAKVTVARQRPYKHFANTPTEPSSEDNLSFFSGHSSFGFALTTGAAYMCHIRHYWTEPYVWGVGITLSLTTEYFRIAADKHYFTDVFLGGVVGIGAGLTIPRLMRRNLVIVPAPATHGLAVAGMF
jgi:membrane-associated phospholipid phosphatase